jgi:hypothetical protein
MNLRPMRTAPKDGTEIVIKARGKGMRRVRYVDCQWIREPFKAAPGLCMDGSRVADCWRTKWGNDVELEDALGWRRAR